MSKYGYHFIYSSCESSNDELIKLDGESFDRLDDAIKFLLGHDDKGVCIMIWQEKLGINCDIIDIYFVDEFNSKNYFEYL